jgi:hypothetical protein
VRRIFWVAVGLGAGATVAFVATRWARQKSQQLAPANLGRQAVETGRDVGRLLKQAASEFRAGMTEREAEIRATLGE